MNTVTGVIFWMCICTRRVVAPQSRQSAELFLQSSELGLPQPLTRSRVCPPGSGGRGTLAGERGLGRVPITTRGHTLWFSLYVHTLWVARTGFCNEAMGTIEYIWEGFFLGWSLRSGTREYFPAVAGLASLVQEYILCTGGAYYVSYSCLLISNMFCNGGRGPSRANKFLYAPAPPPPSVWALKPPSWALVHKTICTPLIYTALCTMFWMRAYPLCTRL